MAHTCCPRRLRQGDDNHDQLSQYSKTLSQTTKLPQIRGGGRDPSLSQESWRHYLNKGVSTSYPFPVPEGHPAGSEVGTVESDRLIPLFLAKSPRRGEGPQMTRRTEPTRITSSRPAFATETLKKKGGEGSRVGINHNLEIGTWYRFFTHVISPKPCNCPVRTQGSKRVVCPLATVHSARMCFPAPPSYRPGGTHASLLQMYRHSHRGQRHAPVTTVRMLRVTC